MTDTTDTYPHHLAGEDADPPKPVARRIFDMALRADARLRHGADPLAVDQLVAETVNWRPAGAIAELFAEANALDPNRNKASDGTIGDARHQTGHSDHNPEVIPPATPAVVRAGDITNDPALHLDQVAERIRAKAAAGQLSQVTAGGYVILNNRITKPDFSGWSKYTGDDPHVSHMHVSSSRVVAQFDSRAPWGVFTAAPAPQPAPGPKPAPAYNWTGPDLSGKGATLRGAKGANGRRMGQLHDFLRRYAPSYAGQLPDASSDEYGWYGNDTAAVLREFGDRTIGKGVADGLNIGPKLALALWRAGFDR
jgi:hypothetical protein